MDLGESPGASKMSDAKSKIPRQRGDDILMEDQGRSGAAREFAIGKEKRGGL
jgi:hypothetical protein